LYHISTLLINMLFLHNNGSSLLNLRISLSLYYSRWTHYRCCYSPMLIINCLELILLYVHLAIVSGFDFIYSFHYWNHLIVTHLCFRFHFREFTSFPGWGCLWLLSEMSCLSDNCWRGSLWDNGQSLFFILVDLKKLFLIFWYWIFSWT
jgi:hypothetical protein